ncbi:esterase/lipase family protein [Aspergillus undulatus]|uniref:esterase/lipase family protein n=1 Tax=Aspergillus undulatus TaxID=1810928 RepID=UPI003CCDF491
MSIREHAQQCAQLFRSPQRLGLDSKALVTEFEAQRSRFKVWAGNLGVFAGGRASADSRFQDDPTARGLLVALIEQLNGKLGVQDNACNNKQTSEMVQEADRSDAESHSSSLNIEADTDSDASSDNSDSNENLRHAVLSDIAHIISRLYQFTSVVRRPGTSNERERILRYVRNREPSLDLCELESHIKWQLGRQCPRTAPGTPLHDRIMAAALYRRQRILYFQSHQAKLQTGTDFVFDLPQRLPGVQASIPTLGTGITNDNVGTHPEGSEKNGPALTLITTEATIHVKLPPSTYAKSAVISGTTPSAVGGLGALDIPPPPRPVGGHGAEAQCPYCMHMIDKEQTSKKRWRRHIMKDIEPYLCLFDDCESGSACFKTIEEWIDHMKWNHTAQHGCQVPGHEDRFFETKEELEQHLLVEHEESLPETGLGELVKEGARPSPDILALLASCLNRQEKAPPGNILLCPMCDFSLSEIDNAVSVDVRHLSVMRFSEDVYKEIRAHIASHLESLALLSLPEREDVEAHSSVNQISHSTGQGTSDDEPETSPLPLSFDDYSSEKNEDNLDLPPLQESWPDLLGDFTFGGNDEYDPHSDNLILSFFQQQASGHSITRDELIQVYPAADDKTTDFNIDVVFVHGLTGDAFSTWEKGNTFWPRDLLPSVRNYRNARILTFQFDRLSPVLAAHGSSGPQILKTWGRVLLYELAKTRTASSWRPIIFVGHSTGGNVIKAALSYSDSWKDDFSSILASTKAAVFFSTPHYGLSDRALVALRARLPYSTARVRRRAEEVNKWSQTLDDITSSYVNLTILNTSYFETRPTNDVLVSCLSLDLLLLCLC